MQHSQSKSVPKPYPGFPLFAHQRGSWKAKIGGRHVSFGPTRSPDHPADYRLSWESALKRYNEYMEARARGRNLAANPFQADIKTVIDAYLSEKHIQAEAGDIDVRTFAEMRQALTFYRDALQPTTTIESLEHNPDPIRGYLRALREKLGYHAYNRNIRYVSAMWNFSGSPVTGSLGRPFKWIELHKVRSVREIRRQRREERAEGKFRIFSPTEINALIVTAAQPVKAMILLGYFAAYGNTDISELPDNAITIYTEPQTIHFHGRTDTVPAGWGLLYFPRPKTEVDRYALVPKVVVDAIADVRAMKIPAATPETRRLMFRTRIGTAVVTNGVRRDDAGLIEKVTVTDNVAAKFDRVLKKLVTCPEHGIVRRKAFTRGDFRCGICTQPATSLPDRGFYCLRHTSTTFASSSGASSDARDVFEGHASGKVRAAFYLDPREMHDLLLVARELESRLTQSSTPTQSASPAHSTSSQTQTSS